MFKNLSIFRLNGSDFDLSTLNKFAEPLPGEMSSSGFVDPRDTGIFHRVLDNVILNFRVDKKVIPKSAIDAKTRERVAKIELESNFKLGRKALKEVRNEITDELMHRALCSTSYTAVWLDLKNGWLVINSSSQGIIDDIIHKIIASVDNFPIESFSVKRNASEAMNEWLSSGEAPIGFTIDSDAVMQATGDSKSAVKYSNQVVSDLEMLRRTEEGKTCVSLAMTWRDKISFVLTDCVTIKKVKILNVLKSSLANEEGFDSEFSLMAMELNLMLSELVGELGGFSK